MSTPHNRAENGDFAKTVLMPGDPLRAKFIAETFLEDPRLVTDVRGMYGYTGTYQGTPVSVMASGMGMPSMGIYSHELFNTFGVESIVRIGTAGALRADMELGSVCAAMGSCTDSNFAAQFHLPGTFAPIASWELLKEAVAAAEANGARYHVGNLHSSDVFYGDHEGVPAGLDSVYGLQKMGVLALEMEAAVNASVQQQNIFIGCAAVADYRAATVAPEKIKKQATQGDELTIKMVKNPDIVAGVAALKDHRPYVVGFAAETNNVEEYARQKRIRKNLDLICANDVSQPTQGFNSDNNALHLFWQDGDKVLPLERKELLGQLLLDEIVTRYDEKNRR